MTIQELANEVVSLCRTGKFEQAQKEYYADDAKSIEPFGEDRVTEGKAAIKIKGDEWEAMNEVHSFEISKPLVAGNFFTVKMSMDITNKKSGVRIQMDELCMFTCDDGKVVQEEFFYNMG